MKIVDVSHKISAPLFFNLDSRTFIEGSAALNMSRQLRGRSRSEFLNVEAGVRAEWYGTQTVIYGSVYNV